MASYAFSPDVRAAACGLLVAFVLMATAQARPRGCEIRDGRLFVDGKWVFLKIGKPLRNFALAEACEKLIADLAILQQKGYNCLELNCYWHHFDKDGDGRPDASLAPLRKLVDAIAARGMFPCLSVETYGVGGGQVPEPFWGRNPDAYAITHEGKPLRDTEYGFHTKVPCLFSPGYRETARRFIRAMAAGIDHTKLLWFETTVEPQYIGNQHLDYSVHARRAYEAWLKTTGTSGPTWPVRFPVPAAFVNHPTWNRFRAEALADWVNGDAAAFRSVAGADAYVAVDYLETGGGEMRNRNGDSVAFLTQLTAATVVQVNWHWHLGTRSTNHVAYRNVRAAMAKTRRQWAICEHMTLNGSDFRPAEVAHLLRSTLRHGTRIGWEFVNVAPSSGDPFALYNDDWSPKPLMAEVDRRWEQWLNEVRREPSTQETTR